MILSQQYINQEASVSVRKCFPTMLYTFKSTKSVLQEYENMIIDIKTCLKENEKVGCGMLAKMLLVKKIGNYTPICIGKKKDFYKRTLAECFVNGESLSKFLVRSGYAFAYRKY